jgi:plastocyanin
MKRPPALTKRSPLRGDGGQAMTYVCSTVDGRRSRALAAVVVLATTIVMARGAAHAKPTTRSFTLVNIEYEGSKIWVPSTLVVKEGDTVRIKLINNVPGEPNQHGFAVPAFNVQVVVTRGKPETVEFVANKEGVYDIQCQLHPAHVGGQLVVLDD